MTKWKSNLKSIKSLNVSSYYGKNWKLVTIYLIIIIIIIIMIITVIMEMIVEMIVMLMNKYNNKK